MLLSLRKNFSESKYLENSILVSIVILVFKIISPGNDSFIFTLINESLIFLMIYFLFSYFKGFIRIKEVSPLSVILNAGILTVLIFFTASLTELIFEKPSNMVFKPAFLYEILSVMLNLVLVGVSIYIFVVLRELFFLRQKSDPKIYFKTMLVFFALALISRVISTWDPELDYFESAIFVMSIIVIVVNSMRVAWIAFLTKRQKLFLLIISIVLSSLFAVNFALSQSGNFLMVKLAEFAVGLPSIFGLLMLYGSINFGVIFFTTLFHLPTAEAIDRKADELSSLMDLSKLLTQVSDLKELSETLTQTTRRVCSANSSWLVIKEEDEYKIETTNNIGLVEADMLTSKILAYNANLDEVMLFDEKSFSKDFKELGLSSIAAVPLKVHNTVKGYLFAARKSDIVFDEDEKRSLIALSHYGAIAIENAQLFEESIIKERLEKELDVAREIQNKILPNGTPKIEGLDISALFIPAFEVGGDYYDFFQIDETKLGFVIADVSGKGISAAFVMAEVKGVFESMANMNLSPQEILSKANQVLKSSLDSKTFVTAIYGIIDSRKGMLVHSRAGHPPLILKRNEEITRISPSGMGLGFSETKKFEETLEEVEFNLKNNDILILYTDGIPEAQNNEMEYFGYQKFEHIIKNHLENDIMKLSNEILKVVTVFSKDNAQHDDITLVIFKWVNNNYSE